MLDIEEKVEVLEEKINDHSAAYKILQQLRIDSKRWFWALIAVLVLWAATIGGFLWFINQYDYISYQQDGEGYNNINTDVQGSVYNNNGSEAQDQEEKGQG